MSYKSDKKGLVVAAAFALTLGTLVSWGAVYGINRYLGPIEESFQTTRR
jgi:hypothetical protein